MTQEEQRQARRRARRRQARIRAQGMLQGVVSMLRPDDVVFDCGANVGEVTAQLVASGAQVHAFEPDPLAFAKLSERFVDAANLSLYNLAVATENGRARLHRAEDFDADPEKRTTRSSIVAGGTASNGPNCYAYGTVTEPARNLSDGFDCMGAGSLRDELAGAWNRLRGQTEEIGHA